MTKSYNANLLSCIPGRFLDNFIITLCIMSTCTLISIVFYFANDSLPIFPLSILPRPRDHEVWGLNLKQNNWFKILFCPVVIYGAIWVGQLFLALIVCGCFYTCKIWKFCRLNYLFCILNSNLALLHKKLGFA